MGHGSRVTGKARWTSACGSDDRALRSDVGPEADEKERNLKKLIEQKEIR